MNLRSLSGLGMGPRRGKSGCQFRRRRGRVAGPHNESATTNGAPRVCRIGPGPSGWTGMGAEAALQRLAGCQTRLRFAPCLHPHSDPTRTHPQARQAPIEQHTQRPNINFDGGDLDRGNGLLLLIRKHLHPMP